MEGVTEEGLNVELKLGVVDALEGLVGNDVGEGSTKLAVGVI